MASDKVYTYAEIKAESEDKNSTVIVIHNVVYDVTDFLNEVSKFSQLSFG